MGIFELDLNIDGHHIIIKPMSITNVIIALSEHMKNGIITPFIFISVCNTLLRAARLKNDEDAIVCLAKALNDVGSIEFSMNKD